MSSVEDRRLQPPPAPPTGIVLAGGAGTRMGRDKSALTLDGRSMLAIALDLLAGVTTDLIVSCRDRAPDPALYPGRAPRIVFDERGAGPLAGLEAALRVAGGDGAVVISVDMPRLTPATLRRLVLAAGDRPRAQAAVYSIGGRPAVFPGFYRRTALSAVSAQLDAGELRVRALLSRLEVVVVEADPVALAAGEFVNVNSTAELAEIGLAAD